MSPPHFLKTHLNFTVPSTLGSTKWSLSLSFPHQNPVYACPLLHSCYMSAHLILLDLITNISDLYRMQIYKHAGGNWVNTCIGEKEESWEAKLNGPCYRLVILQFSR